MSDELAKRLHGSLGKPFEEEKREYDIIILHHINHETLVDTVTETPRFQDVNQKGSLYSHLRSLLKPGNIGFALYYTKQELNEAVEELTGTNILYANKNQRLHPVNFREHFSLELRPQPDSYVLVVQQ